MDDIREDYEDVRQLHYETLRDRQYVSIEAARARQLKLDFTNQFAPGNLVEIVEKFPRSTFEFPQFVLVFWELKYSPTTTWKVWYHILTGNRSLMSGSFEENIPTEAIPKYSTMKLLVS